MSQTKKKYPKRVCPVCLGMYTPKSQNQKYCQECRKNRRYEIQQYLNGELRPICSDVNKPLHDMNAEIEAYNKKHGTCFTYGKYMQYKNAGWLED